MSIARNPQPIIARPQTRACAAQPVAGIPGIGATARVVQGVTQEFRKLSAAMPSLIAVRQGIKTLRCDSVDLRAQPGDMVVYPAHLAADVGNIVAGEGAEAVYVAEFVAFDPDFLLAQAGSRAIGKAARQPLKRPAHIAAAPEGLAQAFRAAAAALTAEPPLPAEIAAHRVGELLLWLSDLLNAVLVAPENTTAARVRSLVSGNPAHDWTANEVAGRIGASEATLRRKLAAEAMGFAEILSDVRMSTALTLIQTSVLPIVEVAAQVGYDSPSRFAAQFRRRFGMAPTAIRGHNRD